MRHVEQMDGSERETERKKESLKVKTIKKFKGASEFNYPFETSKHFSLALGDSSTYCLSVLKNEMPHIRLASRY